MVSFLVSDILVFVWILKTMLGNYEQCIILQLRNMHCLRISKHLMHKLSCDIYTQVIWLKQVSSEYSSNRMRSVELQNGIIVGRKTHGTLQQHGLNTLLLKLPSFFFSIMHIQDASIILCNMLTLEKNVSFMKNT